MNYGFEEAPAIGGFAAISPAVALLGGEGVLARAPAGSLEIHDLLLAGLPGEALSYLIDHLRVLKKTPALERAIGMSLRTVQRRKDAPETTLSADQSGRAWKFAEILALATSIFGSQEDAELWLDSPAMGLDHRRPIDLLATPAGVELVETFLGRLQYGVYM